MENLNKKATKLASGILSALFFAAAANGAPQTPSLASPSNDNSAVPTAPASIAAPADDDKMFFETNRDFKTITLPNGLEVFLTQDLNAVRTAASLSVGTGSLYNPPGKLGLAHFLEHMLFMGTKKYPVPGEYLDFITKNGGTANAFTSDNSTNFHFSVQTDAFPQALYRFSDFFREPLLDKAYAAQEVNAVDSEFNNHKSEDDVRISFLAHTMSNPGHPAGRFSIGNRDTLSGDNEQVLKAFFYKYYAASNMKLAIISPLPLEEQAELVRKNFSDLPDFKVVKPKINPDYRTPLQDKYRLLQVKSLAETQNLTLQFPTIRLADHLAGKPEQIISSILGYEGKGSLLSRLKEEGLALGLSAGGSYSHPNINEMSFDIMLTDKGMQQTDRVMEVFFAYVNMLKEHGIEKYSYIEEKNLSLNDLQWKPTYDIKYVINIAEQMFEYQPQQLITLPYVIAKFEPDAYKEILDTINPGNMMAVLSGPNMKTDKVEPYFGTEYSYSEIGGASFQRLVKPGKVEDISYPAPNTYITKDMEVVSNGPELDDILRRMSDDMPHLAVDDNQAKVWSLFDHHYHRPEAYMGLRIDTPRIFDNVRDYARNLMWNACLQEGMDEEIYPMTTAGLKYQLVISDTGIAVQFGGYTPHIDDMATTIGKNLTACHIDERKFSDIREALGQGVRNRQTVEASRRAIEDFLGMQRGGFSDQQVLAALNQTTLGDVQKYAREFLTRTKISGVAYGNWKDDDVKRVFNDLRAGFGTGALTEKNAGIKLTKLKPGDKIVFSTQVLDNNNALIYSLESDKSDLKRELAIDMMSDALEQNFFQELRTKQQLGYSVQTTGMKIKERLMLNFLIQSAGHDPAELQQRVEDWMKGAVKIFDQMSDKDFENLRENTSHQFTRTPSSIAGFESEMFRIMMADKGFDYRERGMDALINMTKEEFTAFAHEILENPETMRVIVQARAQSNKKAPPVGAYTNMDDFLKARRGNLSQP